MPKLPVHLVLILATLAPAGLSCARTAPATPTPEAAQLPPPLPNPMGWGTHVLAVETAPDGAIWVGTYGQGIYRLPAGSRTWDHIAPDDQDGTSISWGFVNAFAFPADGSVWYGTVGNGFGRSVDGGRTWASWTFDDLGPEWQYVAPNGIRSRGDTVHIATADGLRSSADGGRTWRCVQGLGAPPGGAEGHDDRCTERSAELPTEYLLALEMGDGGELWVGHLHGLSLSRDGGRTWRHLSEAENGVPRVRVRAIAEDRGHVWVATEVLLLEGDAATAIFAPTRLRFGATDFTAELPGAVRALRADVARGGPTAALSSGVIAPAAEPGGLVRHYVGRGPRTSRDAWAILWLPAPQPPVGGTSAGLNAWYPDRRVLGTLASPECTRDTTIVNGRTVPRTRCESLPAEKPVAPRHAWLRRPIDGSEGNPWIDQTYRYGSTMGGNFQQHQGVEFNNPAGTPVRAVADGEVIFAGPAEAGALTVALLHDRGWEDQHVVSTYYHNAELLVAVGERVRANQPIARVGNTGRATNDHLHLEVHVGPTRDPAAYVDPAQRFPAYTVNPQLWLQPVPGTGLVAGRVMDAAGRPVPGARVHGLVVGYPVETPFSFAETYGERAHPDPAYGEHFAVGDVAPGRYLLGVEIDGRRVWRTVEVEAGRLTWVEFTP